MDEIIVDSDGEKLLCAFCSAPFTKEMIEAYNGTYGCETGCEYYTVEVECKSCGKMAYKKGEFGYFNDDKEKHEITEDAWTEMLRKAKITPLTDKK